MEENKTKPQWVGNYKEVRNFLHNELGITKENMQEIIEKIVRDEIAETVGQNGEFIRCAIREIIRSEMICAIQEENYPRVTRNIWDYSRESRSTFNKFISDIAKEEILNMLRNQFEVGFNIQTKVNE